MYLATAVSRVVGRMARLGKSLIAQLRLYQYQIAHVASTAKTSQTAKPSPDVQTEGVSITDLLLCAKHGARSAAVSTVTNL